MNFKELCRTCLRSGEVMSSVFEEKIELARSSVADLLAMFTSVQVDKEDDFPHNICNICLKEIQHAYLFDLKCKKSEIILHQLRELTVTLKKLNVIPQQNDIASEVAGELESILKEDFKLEDVTSLCDRKISDFESFSKTSEKLNLPIVKEECTRDLQLAFKSEPEQSNHYMKDDTNEKDLEHIEIVPNFQIVEDCDPQITLKQEPDHNSPIIRNNVAQNGSELNQNSSNFEIMDECVPEYQVIFNTEPDQNNLTIKDNENEEESKFSEMPSNFQVFEHERVPNFHVTFKSEPELDIGIDCYDEKLECSACLKQFQSLDMLRGHIVSDHLEENICRLCNEEFESSQIEHSAKHLPFNEPENPSASSEESIRQSEKEHLKAPHKDESLCKPDSQCKICSKVFAHKYILGNHMRTHTEKPIDYELCPEMSGNNSALLCRNQTKHTDELNSDDKQVPHLQCSVCYKVFRYKWLLRRHMRVHTGEKPFQCKLCPEKFRKSESLRCHRRTKHTDELISNAPDFQCSVCYKFFGQKYILRNHMRVHTGEKPFQCELCPEKFGNSKTLLWHRRTKHADKLISDDKPLPDFQCSVCYKVFGMKGRLRNHMRSHTGEKPFNCELCPEKFGNSIVLQCHIRTKHTDELISGNKPVPDFQCSVCYKVFGLKSYLIIHMRTHTDEKPFKCEFCPEKFGNTNALQCHRRTKHTNELISDDKPVPDFQCSVCNKIFGLKCHLIVHMRTHTGEKPFNCEFCPEKFGNSNALHCHRRTKHTNELISDDKPVPDFQCGVCYRIFGMKYLLRNHMRVHTGERPFQCKLCPEKFKRNHERKIHEQIKHTDQKQFGCKLCPEKFGHSNMLLRHRRTKHTNEFISDDKPVPDFQCSVCYKAFGRTWLLRNHMRTHTGEKPFNCDFCPEKFRDRCAQLCHRRTKHADKLISDDKPVPDFQCSVCHKVFGMNCLLRRHMRVHTGEKPFECKLCLAKYQRSNALKIHMQTKHTVQVTENPDYK